MPVIPRGLGPCVPVCNADTQDWTARIRVLYVTRAIYISCVICRDTNQSDNWHTEPWHWSGSGAMMASSNRITPTHPGLLSTPCIKSSNTSAVTMAGSLSPTTWTRPPQPVVFAFAVPAAATFTSTPFAASTATRIWTCPTCPSLSHNEDAYRLPSRNVRCAVLRCTVRRSSRRQNVRRADNHDVQRMPPTQAMTIPSPGRPTITVRLGLDDMSCIIDALEGTTHLDTSDDERDHRDRLLQRLYRHNVNASNVYQ